MKNKVWKVGDKYRIKTLYGFLIGTIIKIDYKGYHVKWNDGNETVEDYPDPYQDRLRGH